MWIIRIAQALRLCHTDLLRKMPIEKDIIYIKLENSPLMIECNAKHSMDSDRIYHGTESLLKVNTWLLIKAFSNKARFIPCNRSVRILFNAKHPFVAYYIMPRSRGNQSLSAVSDESIVFFLHRHNPLGILKSLGNSARFSERWSMIRRGW